MPSSADAFIRREKRKGNVRRLLVNDMMILPVRQSLRSALERVAPAALFILALVVGLRVTEYVKFQPDSMHYVDIAKTINSHHQIASFHLNLNSRAVPDPSVLWPPLYPLLLSVPDAIGAPPQVSVRVVAVAMLVAAVGLACALGCVLATPAAGMLCGVSVLALITRMEVFRYGLSESAFIACVLLCLWATTTYIKHGRARHLVVAATGAALAFLCRYVGVVLVPVVAMALLQRTFQPTENKPALKPWSVGLSVLVYAMIIGPWLIRNVLCCGHLLGPSRPMAVSSVAEHTQFVINGLRSDIPLLLALLAIAGAFAIRRCWELAFWEQVRFFLKPHLPTTLFVAGYLALIIIMRSVIQFDALDDRLRSPLYLPMAILAVVAAHSLTVQANGGLRADSMARFASLALALALALHFVPASPGGWRNLLTTHLTTHPPKSSSSIEAWLATNAPAEALVVGHRIWAARFHAGKIVLECGYREMPKLSGHGIRAFLDGHLGRFSSVFLVCDGGGDLDKDFVSDPVCFRANDGRIIRDISGLLGTPTSGSPIVQ